MTAGRDGAGGGERDPGHLPPSAGRHHPCPVVVPGRCRGRGSAGHSVLALPGQAVTPPAYDPSNVSSTAPQFPLGDAQGLQFSATVPSDPQRSQGEPAVTVDLNGRIYSCGPTGFSSVNDFATRLHRRRGPVPPARHPAARPDVHRRGRRRLRAGHLAGEEHRGRLHARLRRPRPADELLHRHLRRRRPDPGRLPGQREQPRRRPAVDHLPRRNTAVFTYNGTAPSGKTIQISTDGGLTYGPSFVATSDSGRIGQIRSFLPAGKTNRVTESIVYIPYSNGNNVKMAISRAGGVAGTWEHLHDHQRGHLPGRRASSPPTTTTPATSTSATATRAARRDAYIVPRPRRPAGAPAPATPTLDRHPKTRMNRATSRPRSSRGSRRAALPGRVAIAFYGTDQIGNPDSAHLRRRLERLRLADPRRAGRRTRRSAMVQATHPPVPLRLDLHRRPELHDQRRRPLAGRLLHDGVQNVVTGGLAIVYSAPSKMPDEAAGHVATPAVIHQVAGPSHNGGTVRPRASASRSLRYLQPRPRRRRDRRLLDPQHGGHRC